jgi:riboflavin kinase / FMN adenylyltransferase
MNGVGAGRGAAVFRSLAEVPSGFGPTVAAIGNFDGVHLGHQEILAGVVNEARGTAAHAVAITFDPHPERFLRPAQAPKLLTPLSERLRLLGATGVDAILVLPFNAELSALKPGEFVRKILVESLGVRSVHEGANFRFGQGAAAGVKELAAFGAASGFLLHMHQAVIVHGMDVSSSAIRGLVAAGDMRRARWMLGRPFAVLSTQARGRGIGTKLLVPTVNLAVYEGLLPAFGVYVTRLKVSGRIFRSVTNVGNRPTFDDAGFAVETHILDFEPIALEETAAIELEFLLRLRGEQVWPSPEVLKAQIMKDVARAKRYFRLCKGLIDTESSQD